MHKSRQYKNDFNEFGKRKRLNKRLPTIMTIIPEMANRIPAKRICAEVDSELILKRL